jgi:hypothetical protein
MSLPAELRASRHNKTTQGLIETNSSGSDGHLLGRSQSVSHPGKGAEFGRSVGRIRNEKIHGKKRVRDTKYIYITLKFEVQMNI